MRSQLLQQHNRLSQPILEFLSRAFNRSFQRLKLVAIWDWDRGCPNFVISWTVCKTACRAVRGLAADFGVMSPKVSGNCRPAFRTEVAWGSDLKSPSVPT